jgi:hypothetical protein
MYSPVLGRFISPDQIVPGLKKPADWNPYTYVRNNPLRYIDPTGYLTKEQIKEWTSYDTDDKLDALQRDHPEVYNMLIFLNFGDSLSSYKDKTGWFDFGYAGLDKHGYLQFSYGQNTFSLNDVIAQSSGGTLRLSRVGETGRPGPAMLGSMSFKGKSNGCTYGCGQDLFALGQTGSDHKITAGEVFWNTDLPGVVVPGVAGAAVGLIGGVPGAIGGFVVGGLLGGGWVAYQRFAPPAGHAENDRVLTYQYTNATQTIVIRGNEIIKNEWKSK